MIKPLLDRDLGRFFSLALGFSCVPCGLSPQVERVLYVWSRIGADASKFIWLREPWLAAYGASVLMPYLTHRCSHGSWLLVGSTSTYTSCAYPGRCIASVLPYTFDGRAEWIALPASVLVYSVSAGRASDIIWPSLICTSYHGISSYSRRIFRQREIIKQIGAAFPGPSAWLWS